MISLPDLQKDHPYLRADFMADNITSITHPRAFLNTTFFEEMCDARDSQNTAADAESTALFGFKFEGLRHAVSAR